MPGIQLKDVLDSWEPPDSRSVGIITDIYYSNYLITPELSSTIQPCELMWRCIEKSHTMYGAHHSAFFGWIQEQSWCNRPRISCEAHVREQQFLDYEIKRHGNIQRHRKEGNVKVNLMSAIRPGLAKIIVNVSIWTYFDSHETDLEIAANAHWIDYTDPCPSKRVHWQSTHQSINCGTENYSCGDTMGLNSGVAWANLPITRIHPGVISEVIIQWLPATLYHTGRMNQHEGHYGWIKAIPILHTVNVKMVYGFSALYCCSVHCHVRSYGLHHRWFSYAEHSFGGILILRR